MNGKATWKIVGNWFVLHISAVTLCWILGGLATWVSEAVWMKVIAGIVCLLAYWGVMMSSGWDLGNSDLNRVKYKHRQKDLLRGFKLGLLVFIPMFVADVLIILARAECFPDFYLFFKFFNNHFTQLFSLLDGTYRTGVLPGVMDVSWLALIVMCLCTLVTPIFLGVGYLLGYKNIALLNKILYKNKSRQKR